MLPTQLPRDMHERIMQRLVRLELERPMAMMLALVFVSALVTGWRVVVRLADTDAVQTFKALFDGFEFSLGFLSDLWTNALEVLPIASLVIFGIQLALLTAGAFFYFRVKHIQTLNRT